MALYYYLIAQLPFLVYEQAPPMSSDEFKELAVSLMTREDSSLLEELSLDPVSGESAEESAYTQSAPSTGCSFIDEWREWERSLRLNLAKHRAASVKRENISVIEPPSVPADAVSTASKAVAAEISPLEGEVLIDKARWNAINQLAAETEYFHRNNVYAYLLKLLLIERRQAFNTDNGFSEYKSLYAQIIESAHNSRENLNDWNKRNSNSR